MSHGTQGYSAAPAKSASAPEHTKALLATAKRLARAAGLPLTPESLALCYAHAAGHRPELTFPAAARTAREHRSEILYADPSERADAAGTDQPFEDEMRRVDDLERRLGEAQEAIRELRLRLARAERHASTDSLTGIANRRGFLGILREAIAAARRHREPLSLLMADVDHFKAFNDRHGHYVGDHVLRLVAAALADLPSGLRHAARYGGEEFAVVLPNATRAQAVAQAESLRQALAARRFIMRGTGEALSKITVSIGVAELARHEFAKQLIRRADAALYKAKRAGRNCVVASEPDRHRSPLPAHPAAEAVIRG